jgi:mono/diheme cytochrome c family protein
MKITRLIILVVLLSATLLTACGSAIESEGPGPVMVLEEPGEVPAEFRDLVNPLEGNGPAIQRGNEAYDALCIQCHGAQGRGDGTDIQGMEPPPGDLSNASRMATLSDGYIFWRISEGGSFIPFNSMMPAWGTLLSDAEIWELVSYLRTLPE